MNHNLSHHEIHWLIWTRNHCTVYAKFFPGVKLIAFSLKIRAEISET